MPRRYKLLLHAFFTLVWFLILPFPFQGAPVDSYGNQWLWFGGFHIIMRHLGVAPDSIALEIMVNKYSYTSYLYPFALTLIAVIAGRLTYVLLQATLFKRRERGVSRTDR